MYSVTSAQMTWGEASEGIYGRRCKAPTHFYTARLGVFKLWFVLGLVSAVRFVPHVG